MRHLCIIALAVSTLGVGLCPTGISPAAAAIADPSPKAGPKKTRRTTKKKPSKRRALPTVAVLYFSYDGADKSLRVLRKGIAELMIADLSRLSEIRVVERVRLESLLAEQRLQRGRKLDRSTAVRLGKLLGAKYLVWGSYFTALGSFCLTGKVIETETGVTLPSAKACGKATDFLDHYRKVVATLKLTMQTKLERYALRIGGGRGSSLRGARFRARAGRAIRSRRGRGSGSGGSGRARTTGSKAGAGSAQQSPPPPAPRLDPPLRLTTRTALQFAQALDAKDRGDKKAARAQLKRLLKQQPNFVQARRLLAQLSR